MKHPFAVALLAAACLLLAGRPGWAADDGAVLTIAGAVGKSNRGAYDAFHDAFFKHHDKNFQKAFAFDRDALKALPQVKITANAEGWPGKVAASGPRLKDVLAAAGIDGKATVTAFALDGYGVDFTAAERDAHDWVVAIEADGKPLGLGGRGPTWIMYDTGNGKASTDEEAKWVWSVFVMTAE